MAEPNPIVVNGTTLNVDRDKMERLSNTDSAASWVAEALLEADENNDPNNGAASAQPRAD